MNEQLVGIGHNSSKGIAGEGSRSEIGYQFQFEMAEKLYDRVEGFKTVTFWDMNGNMLSRGDLRKRGADGGLDLLIKIEAKTELASRQVAGKVWKIMQKI